MKEILINLTITTLNSKQMMQFIKIKMRKDTSHKLLICKLKNTKITIVIVILNLEVIINYLTAKSNVNSQKI
jgi:hypothetical protein